MNWTQSDLDAHNARLSGRPADAPKKRATQSHARGQMNRTEQKYAERLEKLRIAGEIVAWYFEEFPVQLANRVTYTCDFLVCYGPSAELGCCIGKSIWRNQHGVFVADGHMVRHYVSVEAHEVKACAKDGRVLQRDDAWAKLKIAAGMYPWITWRRCALEVSGAWRIEEVE